jgi:hypothetical protein
MTDPHVTLGVSFRATANGTVLVRLGGRLVATLRGTAARRFLVDLSDTSPAVQQQWMARITGNYRRGNETLAPGHSRNRSREN